MTAFSIVCLSPQEWHAELPTNRHQIMTRAAARGHEVLFVETGDFTGRQLWRLVRAPGRRSLARRLFSAEPVAPRIRATKALNLLPWGHKFDIARRANAAATAHRVRRLARRLPAPAVVWVYDPAATPPPGACGEAFAVYDCVDDYAQQARGDPRRSALARAADARVARAARIVFATARPLYERHRAVNPSTYHVPNVADYAHFAPAADPSTAADDVRDLASPVIGFAGNLLASKVDFELLDGVATARPDWTFLLVGPAQNGAEAALQRLTAHPNVRHLGRKPYAELPRYVAAFDVGLCPYQWSDEMRSCFPLKLYEYLAAGKPVVASGTPELAGMEPDVRLAHGPDEFAAAVEAALGQRGEADAARRQARAAPHTWEARADRLLGLVSAQLNGAGRS